MPTHGYRTERKHFTVLDHTLAHCWEILLSAWAMLGGLAAVVAALLPERTVSRSLDQLSSGFAAFVGALLVLGGVGIIRGLFDDSEDLMVGWRYERMGLVLSSAGWFCYGAAILFMSPHSFLSWSLCLTVVAASVLRFIATIRSERATRSAVTQ